ncbi:MAG: hypothetical protein ACFNME_07755, partial [Actinomyces dentalis]
TPDVRPADPAAPSAPSAPGGDGEITAEEFNAAPPDAPGCDPSRPSPTTFTLHVFKTTPE